MTILKDEEGISVKDDEAVNSSLMILSGNYILHVPEKLTCKKRPQYKSRANPYGMADLESSASSWSKSSRELSYIK